MADDLRYSVRHGRMPLRVHVKLIFVARPRDGCAVEKQAPELPRDLLVQGRERARFLISARVEARKGAARDLRAA